MAATEQLFNVRERKRFERHDIWERIAENGTMMPLILMRFIMALKPVSPPPRMMPLLVGI